MVEPLYGPVEQAESRCSEHYLLGRVHCDGSGTTEAGCRVRRDEPDALRRRLPPPPVLVSNRVQTGRGDAGASRPAESSLHRRRDAAVAAVSDDPGARKDRDHAVAAPERRLPIPHRAAELPRGHDAPALLAARGSDRPPQTARPARSLSPPDDWTASATAPAALRPSLPVVGRVRAAGTRGDRLQPDQAGPPLVSPVALLRGPDQGLLAWRVATGRRTYCQRDPRSARRVLREDPGRSPADDCPRRQRVLRSHADRRALTPPGAPLCSCPPPPP